LYHCTEPAPVQERKTRSQGLHSTSVLGTPVETDAAGLQVHAERLVVTGNENIASRMLEWIVLACWHLLATDQLVGQGID
jgi:hypothetical protein